MALPDRSPAAAKAAEFGGQVAKQVVEGDITGAVTQQPVVNYLVGRANDGSLKKAFSKLVEPALTEPLPLLLRVPPDALSA